MSTIGFPASSISNHPSTIANNQGLRLIANLSGMNLNSVGDTIVNVQNIKTWYPLYLIGTNASTNLTTAAITINTGANGTGDNLFTTSLVGLTSSTAVIFVTNSGNLSEDVQRLYFRCTTAQGAVATADFWVYGWDLGFLS